MRRNILLIMLLATLSGCNLLGYPTYLIFGPTGQKVKAEYTGLNEQKIAVVVAAGPGIAFEYPYAGIDLARLTSLALQEHLENVTFVDPEAIDRFQREDLDWPSLPIDQIGRRLDAQCVLYLDLTRFTTLEENSVNLLRGYINADVRVYQVQSPHCQQPAYQTALAIIHPEQGPLSMSDPAEQALYQQTIAQFAQQLARKFYDHRVPAR